MLTTNTTSFDIYSSSEFFAALQDDIETTKEDDQVAITTMMFEPREHTVADLTNKLAESAMRGADVLLGVDAYTFLYPSSFGPLSLPTSTRSGKLARYRDKLSELDELGVQTFVTNQPTRSISVLAKDRSHFKFSVVRDRVYIGGPNLHGTDRSDMVIGFNHSGAANWLYNCAQDLAQSGSTQVTLGVADKQIRIDDTTKILIDAGQPKQSYILEVAADMIDAAEEYVIFSSQYFPDGKIAARLEAAHKRNCNIHILYNNPSRHNYLRLAHRCILAAQRLSKPAVFFDHMVPDQYPFMHAKVVATEKSALVGTHNLFSPLIQLGTPEISLLRQNADFAAAVKSKLLKIAVSPAQSLAENHSLDHQEYWIA